MHPVRILAVVFVASLALPLLPAHAVIMRPTPLADVLAESSFILVAKVESLDAEKLQMVLGVTESLKEKAPFKKLPMLLRGDAEATRGKQVPKLLRRLQVGLPMVLFVNQRDREFVAFGYTNGTWFQATGIQPKDDPTPRWTWAHFEPYLRRTFKGTTQELRDVIADVLAGKKKPPEHNPKEEPGLGPEVKQPSGRAGGVSPLLLARREVKPQHGTYVPRSPVFGVIVAPWLLGPLALLGMLFPALFGGLVEGMRRWMVWISVVSLNSTLVVVRDFLLVPSYPDSWWSSELCLWLEMVAITILGAWLAWHLHVSRVISPTSLGKTLGRPGRGELFLLILLAGLGTIPFFNVRPTSLEGMSILMKTWAVIEVGLLVATGHAIVLALVRSRNSTTSRLPGEGVALLATLLMTVLMIPTTGTKITAQPLAQVSEGTPGVPTLKGVVWKYDLPGTGWIASSPAVVGDRVYFGAVHGSAFRNGAVHCLDARTGEKLWSFNNDRKMKDVFCSPTVVDGCVYIGEGFHQHLACRLYCLDAQTGEKKWEFETNSHTESTPAVVAGKVYFGAGDDGLYCLDAKTGKVVWQLPGLHIDSNPLVVGGRVYAGSGKGDAFQEFALVCLDAQTGKEVWPRVPLDLPAWGGPALAGDLLLVGIGNGNFMESEANPAGAVLGIDIRTGKRIWRTDMKDGVHVKLATDGTHVWVGARDNTVACLTVADGKKVWEKDLASPIVASPALVPGLLGARLTTGLGDTGSRRMGTPTSLIVATSAGGVVCLDPHDGAMAWTFNVAQDAGTADVQMFSSPCVEVTLGTEGERRRIFFGSGLNTFNKGTLYCLEDERKASERQP